MNNYTRSLYKKRNITKKTYKYFMENLNKYLTPDEMSKLTIKNELMKYSYTYPKIDKRKYLQINYDYHKNKSSLKIKMFIKKINKYILDIDHIYLIDDHIWKIKLKEDNYFNYYINHKCKKYNILNVDLLAKKFPFFSISEFELNPLGTKILFGVDFIGSRMYHLFIKELYNNQIKEIKLPAQPVASMKDIYNENTRISDIFLWINDDEICYISQNKYFNQNGIYIYNINTNHKYLLKKIPPGKFGNIYISSDLYYIIISISDYNTEELYIIDNDGKLICGKPIIQKKESVTYPYIDHIDGEWIIYERNKTHDLFKRTTDFKTYKIDYSNSNMYEIVNTVVYIENTYMFTLIYQNGIKLFSLKCNKLIEHINEKTGYIEINDEISYLKDFTYNVHYYLSNFKTYKINDSLSPFKTQYYEEKVYINPHLFCTVLSKQKPYLSKCVLYGYGSYSTYESCEYSPHYVALIESGYTVIIAHLRGGGEYGYKGYMNGRLLHKKNTFIDFITIADYIVEHKITTRDKLAIWGRSAGGLLISTVINIRPDLCKLAILGVPFIDINSTLNNIKTPLGMETSSEYGNINDKKIHKYIDSYSPLKHINKNALYPNIFIYTNVHDTLVPFNGPLLYYNTIKEAEVFKTKQKEISIFIDPQFGHTQGSSIQKKMESYAIIFDQITRYIL